MLSASSFAKLLVLVVSLTSTCLASGCKGLDEYCNADCDCCGYPQNPFIRCETRNQILGKRCYRGVTVRQTCSTNSDCLSQTCKNGICVHNNRPPRPPVGYCPLSSSNDKVTAVDGRLPQCSCSDDRTSSVAYAIDGDLSTDYINNYSKGYSGLIIEPSFKAPVRKMEVCTSNQNKDNDPQCYRVEGWCDVTNQYMLIQDDILPLTIARQDCMNVTFSGRRSYNKYRVQFGCRRGGYTDSCVHVGTAPPTAPPTSPPTNYPTNYPTAPPTSPPTNYPTDRSIASPTAPPTSPPTNYPTDRPTARPTSPPTNYPTNYPTAPPTKPPTSVCKAGCPQVTPLGKDPTCTTKFPPNENAFSEFKYVDNHYDNARDVTLHTYSFLNKIGNGGSYPDLSHAVLQYLGGCCISKVRVYTIQNGRQTDYETINSPGDHLQRPDPTTCMSGIKLPGVVGSNTFYFELTIGGNFPLTAMGDYALKGGTYVKYAQTLLPYCRCDNVSITDKRRFFRGLQLDQLLRKRAMQQTCSDQAVSISEVRLLGKCNEG